MKSSNSMLLFILTCFVFSSFSKNQPSKFLSPDDDLKSNEKQEMYDWLNKIRDNHPRLFFNQSSLQTVKKKALEEEKEVFYKIKDGIDKILDKEIEFTNLYVQDGGQNSNHQYGFRAAESALLYKFLQEDKYLTFTKDVLVKLIDYYQLRNEANLNIQWYAFSQIAALCAFDWIYSDLSREEQIELGSQLLEAINYMVHDGSREPFFRENTGDHTTGFYGPLVLPWYAGLVFYKTGINDSLAEKLLLKGYEDHIKMLEYRKFIVGTNGGAATASMEYAFALYPWAEFNFLHTFNSATGIDLSKSWDYMVNYLYYMDWNWLPKNREYGYGDVRHRTCKLPTSNIYMHLAQLMHFYGEGRPEFVALAKRLQNKMKIKVKTQTFSFMSFFVSTPQQDISLEDITDSNRERSAVFFENMGQIFMRSGTGENDTYALFSAGGIVSAHKHFDNNNFVIYKNGYRALDSGTRPQPGLHLSHYYCRTIAHNCVTIEMPGEVMPDYWGGPALSEKPEPVPNDGGQNNRLGSKVLTFNENKEYVYIASDATESYHKDKTSLVLRQFVYILPDVFIVFDKVISTDPTYKKTWLLHTAAEPKKNSLEFSEESEEGRLICRTLFPEDALMTKIGGLGKQFWSGGKNWALPVLTPDDWNYKGRHLIPDDTHPLLGQWRIEVSPSNPALQDNFLHLIQVGDLSLQSLPEAKLIKGKDTVGVIFEYNAKRYEVMFSTDKNQHDGNINIKEGNRVIRNESFNSTNLIKTDVAENSL